MKSLPPSRGTFADADVTEFPRKFGANLEHPLRRRRTSLLEENGSQNSCTFGVDGHLYGDLVNFSIVPVNGKKDHLLFCCFQDIINNFR